MHRLVRKFKALDLALAVLQSRIVASVPFAKVQESIESMTSEAFTVAELDTLMRICPDAIVVNWMPVRSGIGAGVVADEGLCLRANKEWPTEVGWTRERAYTTALEKALEASEAAGGPVGGSESALPVRNAPPLSPMSKPKSTSPHSPNTAVRGSNTKSRKHSRNATVMSVLGVNVNGVLTTKDDDSTGAHREKGGRAAVTAEAAASEVTGEKEKGPAQKRMRTLEELEAYASESSAMLAGRLVETARQTAEATRKARLGALPVLCDVLHTTCMIKKRRIFFVHALVDELSASMRLSQEEVTARLRMCATVVPDYLTMLPLDKLLPQRRVKVNMETPYAKEMRATIVLAVNKLLK
jgi:hypothetical protein